MTTKSDFLKKFNESFAKSDIDFILECMSEDIVWTMVGENTYEGKQAVHSALKEMKNIETLDLKLSRIITNQEFAAANGSMKIKEASGKIQSFAFADFYEFSPSKDLKINNMISYVLPLNKPKRQDHEK